MIHRLLHFTRSNWLWNCRILSSHSNRTVCNMTGRRCQKLDQITSMRRHFHSQLDHLEWRRISLFWSAQTFLGEICEESSSRCSISESVKKDLEAMRCQRREGKSWGGKAGDEMRDSLIISSHQLQLRIYCRSIFSSSSFDFIFWMKTIELIK
jgi:hypothetical protein